MIPPPVGGGATSRRRCYVYLLQSTEDKTFYIGWTTDLLRRLVEHNQALSGYSKRKLPWKVVGVEAYQTPEAAKARERALKRNPRMGALFKKRMLNRAAVGRPRQVVG